MSLRTLVAWLLASAAVAAVAAQQPVSRAAADDPLLTDSPAQREQALAALVEAEVRPLLSAVDHTGRRKSPNERERDRQHANALRGWFVRGTDKQGAPEKVPPYGLALLPDLLKEGRPASASLREFIDQKVLESRRRRVFAKGEPDWLAERSDSYQEAYFRYEATFKEYTVAYRSFDESLVLATARQIGCQPVQRPSRPLERCSANATFDGEVVSRWVIGDGTWYRADGSPVPWLKDIRAGSPVFDRPSQYGDVPPGWYDRLQQILNFIGTAEKVDMLSPGDGSRLWILRGPNIDPVDIDRVALQSVTWRSLDLPRAVYVSAQTLLRVPCVGDLACVYHRLGSNSETARAYFEVHIRDTSQVEPLLKRFYEMASLYKKADEMARFDKNCRCVRSDVETPRSGFWAPR